MRMLPTAFGVPFGSLGHGLPDGAVAGHQATSIGAGSGGGVGYEADMDPRLRPCSSLGLRQSCGGADVAGAILGASLVGLVDRSFLLGARGYPNRSRLVR